ncbi:MAG: AsmA family protein [Deltaproteobacteria bacterium]|nr:AsmA family protein [Deltaproteobacteria bacterium]
MRWKWILGISIAVIMAVFVTAYIIASSYDVNKFKPRITQLAKEYTGRELTFGGDIELGLSLFPTLVVNDVAFQNASWGSRPQMAQIKRLEAQIALLPLLRGNLHIRRLTAENPDILIEIDKSGKPNFKFEIPREPEPKAVEEKGTGSGQYFPKLKKMEIEGGAITYKDHQRGRTEAIAIEKLRLESSRFGATVDVNLKFSLNKTPFEIRGELGQPSEIINPDEQWPLNITIETVGSTITLAGHITNITDVKGIDLKLAAKGPDIANFQQITGEPLPVKGPFDVAGHLTAPTLENLKMSDITVSLGESRINGEITFNQISPRSRINARFQSEKLDLRPFIKRDAGDSQTEIKTEQKQTQGNRVFSAEPFNLQGLHQVDAGVSFSADQILTHRLALDKFQIDLSLKKGHLSVKPLMTQIGRGDFSSSLDLLAKENHADLTATITAKKIDFGEMLKKLEIANDLDGVMDLDINISGQGKSVAALMAGLNGDIIAYMSQGRVPVDYLKLLSADITTGLFSIINPLEKKIDRASINCAVVDFNIQDGLARSDVIMIDDPEKTLLSKGTVDLKTEALDLAIYTKPKKGIGTKETGKLSLSLSQITKPFKLGGTLANPSLGISPERAITTAGQALLGPPGWASLLVSGSFDQEGQCAAALKIAGRSRPKTKAASGDIKEQQKNGSKNQKEGVGSKIKNLFRKQK